jgi:hypothetical protein
LNVSTSSQIGLWGLILAILAVMLLVGELVYKMKKEKEIRYKNQKQKHLFYDHPQMHLTQEVETKSQL